MSDDDAELHAATELHARIQKARRKASLTSIVGGLVLGVLLAVLLHGALEAQLGGRFGTLALIVVFFAPMLGALKAAEMVADTTVRRSVDSWMEEIAKKHGIAPSALEDHARIARAKD